MKKMVSVLHCLILLTTAQLAACGGGSSGGEGGERNNEALEAKMNISSATAVAGQTITLDGSSSTPSRGLTFQWEQTEGPEVELIDANAAVATFVAPSLENDTTLTFKLTVNHATGTSPKDDIQIQVKGFKLNASTTNAFVMSTGKTTLLAQASEDNSGTYLWERIDGNSALTGLTLSNETIANPELSVGQVETDTTVRYRVTMTNPFGDTRQAEVGVYLLSPIRASAGEFAVAGQPVSLEGASGVGNPDLTYQWEHPQALVELTGTQTAQARFEAPKLLEDQNLNFRLKVSSATATSFKEIQIPVKGFTISANAAVAAVSAGGSTMLSAQPSTGNSGQYVWQRIDGTTAGNVSLDSYEEASPQLQVGVVEEDTTVRYRVTMTNDYGQSSQAEVNLLLLAGIKPYITSVFPNRFALGDSTKVSGSGFNEAMKVSINDQELRLDEDYKIINDHYIRLTLSESLLLGPGQYQLSVANTGGTANAPMIVAPALVGVTEITSGDGYTCALLDDETVHCWGRNSSGQLGNNTIEQSHTPVEVNGLTGVTLISAGSSHACALLSNQTVRCWGRNSFGQLGNNTIDQSRIPVEVNGLTGVTLISAGSSHTCALLSDQTVHCWGLNDSGQLGNGTAAYNKTPVEVSGLVGVASISVSESHSCALLHDETVRCWGRNSSGQLGNNTIKMSHAPLEVSGLVGVTSISVNGSHSCALLHDETVRCWGWNSSGQLGNNTIAIEGSHAPVKVFGLTGVASISAGYDNYTCALLNDGTVRCWGSNSSGQLGDGTVQNSSIPVEVLDLAGVASISAGYSHNCALMIDKTVRCWRWGTHGTASIGNKRASVVVSGLTEASSITAGKDHTCSLLKDETVRCWGRQFSDQSGNRESENSYAPLIVNGLAGVKAINAGREHSCALLNDETVYCWGSNLSGQFGNGTTKLSKTPVKVSGLTNVKVINAGSQHTCALLNDETVHCWGSNDFGQFGNHRLLRRHHTIVSFPVEIDGLTGVTSISAGFQHTCALQNDKTVRCWGSNPSGQLGNDISGARSNPVEVSGLTGVTSISAGSRHTCALLNDKTVHCWGSNDFGQLGDGTTENSSSPLEVKGLSGVIAITTGGSFTCALYHDGYLSCWGNNDSGQLTLEYRTPARVLLADEQ